MSTEPSDRAAFRQFGFRIVSWHLRIAPSTGGLHIDQHAPDCAKETADPTRRECPEMKPSMPTALAHFVMIRRALMAVRRSGVMRPPRRILRNNAPDSISPALQLVLTASKVGAPMNSDLPLPSWSILPERIVRVVSTSSISTATASDMRSRQSDIKRIMAESRSPAVCRLPRLD